VTSATKSNAINYSMVFWDDVFREVSAKYQDVQHEQQLIDSLCARFVTAPESLDVVVASNLFGDILTDLGAAIAGSMGLAPSANLNPEGRYPSMFQAIHGSAPGLTGKGIANPIATIWSVSMMLDHLGEAELGKALLKAIESVIAEGKVRTPDLGGESTTRQMGQAVIAALRKPGKSPQPTSR
jgi:tartrate dehydrogenase/decarboxylase/D-malate dehydrogenase